MKFFSFTCVILFYSWSQAFHRVSFSPFHNSLKIQRSWCSKLFTTPEPINPSVILGLNENVNDPSCCILDKNNGKVLFSQSLSHFYGNTFSKFTESQKRKKFVNFLKAALASQKKDIKDIEAIVSNNYQYRCHPFLATSFSPLSITDLLLKGGNDSPKVKRYELSNHLAHAWAGLGIAPLSFDKGLIVVLHDKGESYYSVMDDYENQNTREGVTYIHDLKLLKDDLEGFSCIKSIDCPKGKSVYEGESAYLFDRKDSYLKPYFKRWANDISYKPNQELTDSLASVYYHFTELLSNPSIDNELDETEDDDDQGNDKDLFHHEDQERLTLKPVFRGRLFAGNEDLDIEFFNMLSQTRIKSKKNVLVGIQKNIEEKVLTFLKDLKEQSGEENLILTGKLASNPQLNKAILDSKLFKMVCSPLITENSVAAIGTSYFGFQTHNAFKDSNSCKWKDSGNTLSKCFMGGSSLSNEWIGVISEDFSRYFNIHQFNNMEELTDNAAEDLKSGKVIGWFQGNSNFGNLEFGSRSLLINPNSSHHKLFLDANESERATLGVLSQNALYFLPSCGETNAINQYTASLASNVSRMNDLVSREFTLQLFNTENNPLFAQLLERFYNKTQIPGVVSVPLQNFFSHQMLGFPDDILRDFLAKKGSISSFFVGNVKFTLKPFPLSPRTPKFKVQNPTIDEEDLLIRGKIIDQIQTTYQRVLNAATVDRIKVLVAHRPFSGPFENISKELNENKWIELPSDLYLEILQILNEIPDVESMVKSMDDKQTLSESSNTIKTKTNPMNIGTLWDYLKDIRDPQKNSYLNDTNITGNKHDPSNSDRSIELLYEEIKQSELLEWTKVKEALSWLYYRGLVEIYPDKDKTKFRAPHFPLTTPQTPEPDKSLHIPDPDHDEELKELRQKFPYSKEYDAINKKWK